MITSSEALNHLSAALSKFQGEVENAKKSSVNPHFKSRYADLAEIWDTVRAPLAANGLAVVQLPCESEAGHVGLTTLLVHSSGQWLKDSMRLRLTKDDAQGAGSALTYARRYALAAVLGIAQEDDDANAASNKGKTNVTVTGGVSTQGAGLVGSATRPPASGSTVGSVARPPYGPKK